ncbi:MAG: homoserine dehydrogenase, partial [Verrucomicrobiota bacterium]
MDKMGIGLVGCGTVGSGLVRNLSDANRLLQQRLGVSLELRAVAVRDPSKKRADLPVPPVGDWKSVISNPAVQIVAELLGGTTESLEVAKAAIAAGKPLITANKALLAEKGSELIPLAQKARVPIYFEASVAGGIPV